MVESESISQNCVRYLCKVQESSLTQVGSLKSADHEELTTKVEAILPTSADLSKLAANLPPELASLLQHPQVLEPVMVPAGGPACVR